MITNVLMISYKGSQLFGRWGKEKDLNLLVDIKNFKDLNALADKMKIRIATVSKTTLA